MIRARRRGPGRGRRASTGVEAAAPPPEVLEAIAAARAIVDRPVEPGHLDRPDPRRARHAPTRCARRAAPVVAVSPARRRRGASRARPQPFMAWAGPRAVRRRASRRCYGDLLDGLVATRPRRAAAAALQTDDAHGRRRRARGASRARRSPSREACVSTADEHGRRPARQALRRRQAAPGRGALAPGRAARWPRRWSPTCSIALRRVRAVDAVARRHRASRRPTALARGHGADVVHDPAEAATARPPRCGVAARASSAARDRVAARARRLPGARPRGARRAARAPVPRAAGRRSSPTATAPAPTRCCSRRRTVDRAGVRARQPRAPRAPGRGGRAPRARCEESARSCSTSTPPTTSRRCRPRSARGAAAPRTRAGCSSRLGAAVSLTRHARSPGLPEVRAGRRPRRAARGARGDAARPATSLVVAHKVVSKAEGRARRAWPTSTPGARARAAGRASTARTRARSRSCSRDGRGRARRARRAHLPHPPRVRVRQRRRRRLQRRGRGRARRCCRCDPDASARARCARALPGRARRS